MAIKFVKSNKNYMEAARDEIKIMNVLNDPINNNHHIPKENISYFKNDNKLHPGYNHVIQLKMILKFQDLMEFIFVWCLKFWVKMF